MYHQLKSPSPPFEQIFRMHFRSPEYSLFVIKAIWLKCHTTLKIEWKIYRVERPRLKPGFGVINGHDSVQNIVTASSHADGRWRPGASNIMTHLLDIKQKVVVASFHAIPF